MYIMNFRQPIPEKRHMNMISSETFEDFLPASLYLKKALMPEQSAFPEHSHAWGEFVYVFDGLLGVEISKERFLVSPQYGMWIPPELRHSIRSRWGVSHAFFYVERGIVKNMPKRAVALKVSAFLRAILEHASDSDGCSNNEAHMRLLAVLLDELENAPAAKAFLPAAHDEKLLILLRQLEEQPEDNRTIAELANNIGLSERTLARKSLNELGLSISEWRNRARVAKAIALIGEGRSVNSVAKMFGYSTASAFIAMFRRITGTTPAQCSAKPHFHD